MGEVIFLKICPHFLQISFQKLSALKGSCSTRSRSLMKRQREKRKRVPLDQRQLECEIATLGEKLEQMTPNMAAIEEYRRKEEEQKES